MTYNPCGHGVDFGRRSYTVTVRPFRDSNITTTLLWYPADRKKGPLPFPSRISSLDWATEPHRHEGIGEVYGADRKFVNNRGLGPIAGDHICGTEDDFRNGAKLSDGRPVLTYLPSGLPTCCDPGRREAVLLLGVDPVSRVYRGRVYRSEIPLRVAVLTRTIRSDPYRSDISVSLRTTTRTVRSDPYHSTAVVRVLPTTHTLRSDPYHSTAVVRVIPESDATTTPPSSGCTSFVAPGGHVFIPTFTGDHDIRCWAAGGPGADAVDGGGMGVGGGGGGGGAFSFRVLSLVAGTSYDLSVGPAGVGGVDGGDTWFRIGVTTEVLAKGGAAASGSTGGLGGAAGDGIGDRRYNGGHGADGLPSFDGGGGGGGADDTPDGGMTPGDGGSTTDHTGGTSIDTGAGGDGGTASAEGGHDGEAPGGGGGGGQADGGAGGDGAGGLVVICWPAE